MVYSNGLRLFVSRYFFDLGTCFVRMLCQLKKSLSRNSSRFLKFMTFEQIKPFPSNVTFLSPLETSENRNVWRVYRNVILRTSGLSQLNYFVWHQNGNVEMILKKWCKENQAMKSRFTEGLYLNFMKNPEHDLMPCLIVAVQPCMKWILIKKIKK